MSSSDEKVLEPVSSFTKDNLGSNEVVTSFTNASGKVVSVKANNVDQAMDLALDIEGEEYDPVADKKLLRKIDWYILPLFCIIYCVQFADKTTNSYAAVMGLRTYFHMEGDMYSWVGTAFYFGYLAFEFPASTVIQRFPVAKTTALFIVIWGLLLCLHATPKTYPGFMTLRTLLGVFESVVTPAMVILTGQWYRKEEQFFRTGIWFAFNGMGTILGGGIAYGLATHEDSYAIPAWKLLFVVVGCITIFLGVVFFFHIPDTPAGAWFLTTNEKKMVVLRIRDNQQGFGNPHFRGYQFKEALCDVQTWLFFFFAIASNIPNGALTNFGSIILNSDFGYTPTKSLLMNMPCGAVELVGCILMAASGNIFPRLAVSFASMIIALVCACMLAFSPIPRVGLAGYYAQFVYPITMICNLSCFSSNTAGHTKKITVNAIYLIGYCVGNIVGPQTFIPAQAPSYNGGKVAIVVCDVASLFLIVAIAYVYWSRNKKKDAAKAEGTEAAAVLSHVENIEFADLTDKENPFFRYSL